jgi:predicted naringenin-chalcone synthase
VPENTINQAESLELATQLICQNEQQARLLKVLYRKSGVNKRHTVLPHRIALNWLPQEPTAEGTLGPTTGERMRYFAEHAPPLAHRAAARAIEESAVGSHDITHLVTVTCTGFDAPGIDIDLIRRLRLRPTTQRVQVGFMGCHGAINALRVVSALCAEDTSARVLVCAVELSSLHCRFRWDPERIVSNTLFADGAAAIVAGVVAGPPGSSWRVLSTGSCLVPDSTDAMTWRIGDHGFEMTLDARVPEIICTHLRPWLAEWLHQYDYSIESIGSWAVHPGGPRILGAVEESLGLSREATAVSRDILANFGNMSSPTLLFIIERMIQQNAHRPCVALGFGPGLVAEAALLI